MPPALQSYPAYRPSGVEWLGDVPAHWEQLPGRACYLEKSEQLNTDLQETTVLSLSYGRIVVKPADRLHGLVPASFETYQIVEPGDIVVRPTDLQNDWTSLRFGLSSHHGIITSAYMCLCTNKVMLREYGHLLLHTYDLKKVFYGLGSGLRQNLSWSDFKFLPCVVPPLAEQAAIVRYLDHADDRIRRYISAKERLITLLEEQKQAIIHRAVTRGLDPHVPLKPSGVEWLGDVPDHWEVRRLKHVCSDAAMYGANIPATYYQDEGIRFLRTSDIADDGSLQGGGVFLPTELVDGYILSDGDILLSRSGTVGRSFLYSAHSHGRCAYAGYLVRFVPNPAILPKYLFLFTKTAAFGSFLRTMAISSTIENVNAEKYANGHLPLPPLSEQSAIARYLDEATANMDTAIARARRQIELLREYRTRLIADVVTGKLDVRAAAAHLPDEADHQGPIAAGSPMADGLDEEIYDAEAVPATAGEVRI